MTTALNPRPVRRGRPGVSEGTVRKVAGRILALCIGDAGEAPTSGVVSVPSERELSKRLAVTRHTVRNALDHLADNGDVQRVAGRTPVVVVPGATQAPTDAPVTGTRCINFIQGPSLSNPALQFLFYRYLAGYNEVLDHYDFKTRFLMWGDERTDYDELLWHRVPWAQQACILVNRSFPPLLNWLDRHGVPFVVQCHRAYDAENLTPHHKVYVNKTGGAYDATSHLLELGHQQIGFVGVIGGLRPDGPPSPQYEGYHAAMRCAGLTPAANDLLSLNVELPELAIDACRAYLEKPNRPTAVIVANAGMTAGMLRAAQGMGLRVPQDLSVVGFGGDEDHEIQHATFTRLPQRELAQASVELLMDVLSRKACEYQARILNCDLHVGDTTAPPHH